MRLAPYLAERLEALTCAATRERAALLAVPLRLTSWANARGASRAAAFAKARKVSAQRMAGALLGRHFRPHLAEPHAFAVVVLTRVAPRPLDSDNLEGAFKAVRDGIAEVLGVNDRAVAVRYLTSQERGSVEAVRAELFLEPTGLTTKGAA